MGNLDKLLSYSRLPHHLRTITTRQKVAELAFEAMKRNGEEGEERYKREKEQERIREIQAILDGNEKIAINSVEELKDYLSIILEISKTGYPSFDESGINNGDLFGRYKPKTLLIFLSVKLGLTEQLGSHYIIGPQDFVNKNEHQIIEFIQTRSPELVNFCGRIGVDLPERKAIHHGPKS